MTSGSPFLQGLSSSGKPENTTCKWLDLFSRLPADYDEAVYREHKDLELFSAEQLLQHWLNHGIQEGRSAATVRDRKTLMNLQADLPILNALEIGCFDQPSLEHLSQKGIVTHYADYLSESELKKRAAELPGRDPARVPPIEYILSNGYEQINRSYDIVVSHHCIEHQPDLLSHLLSVSEILRPKGLYIASVPDKRFCFDHFLPVSTLIDVLAAFYEKRVKPSFRSVLEHRCFIVEDYNQTSDPLWNCDAGRASRQGFDRAFQEFSNSRYVDVHTFQFTSFTFKNIVNQLTRYGYLPPETRIKIYNGISEFYLALQF
jgi:SAM-dependent methyltransferase